ncbi:RNA polymerase sigma factor [Roseomonas sp. 18066]|uniref:RNA polymerase sigma factor n=1 Tax=Roseomonas sp. 18066 TaxID=2681412 RepID=UPI001356B69A|nr:sigma-70 family RNA polymerase sigma factor [Roseomonas sp. 18066]
MAQDPDSLFRLHRSRLKAEANRRLRDGEASADAVQDTFVRYLARLRDAERAPVENPPGFLRRILSNLVSNRQMRAPRGHLPVEDVELADGAPDGEAALLTAESRARLARLIGELPPRGRQVIYLHKFRGLSYAEIAQKLGISENTVMVHMSRSLAALRRRLREENGDDR